MSYEQRRAGQRRGVRVAVTVETDTVEFAAMLTDAGPRGAYIQADESVAPGAPIKIRFKIDGHDVLLAGEAIRNATTGPKGPGFAIEFDLDAAAIFARLSADGQAAE